MTSFAGTVYRFNQADGAILSANKTRATSAPVIVGRELYFTKRVDGVKEDPTEAVAIVDGETQNTKLEANRRKAEYLDKKVQSQSGEGIKGAQLDAGNGFAGGAPVSANAQPALDNIGKGNVSTLQAFQGSRILNYRDNNFNVMGDEICCTDPTNGKMRWSFKLTGDLKKVGGSLAAPPAAAGGQVFVGTLKGEVLQMNPKDGRVAKTYKIGSPIRCQPIIEGGRIYVGTDDGKVVCLDTGNKEFTGWSTWGGNAAHTGVQK